MTGMQVAEKFMEISLVFPVELWQQPGGTGVPQE